VPVPLVGSTLASGEVDVILYVDITHPDPSPLSLTMMSPLTPEAEVSQWVVVWAQEATAGSSLVLHEAVVGLSGDEVANGEWSLVVEDHAAGPIGTINAVWVEMTSRWD
jgi:subtilisin-like proprotein convertase family protein